LFDFFRRRPEMLERPVMFNVLLHHLPAFVRENIRYRGRVKKLPVKIQCAILASEIASSIVYNGGWEDDFEGSLSRYLEDHFK
jgi:glutamate dehydrogenase